MEEILIVLPYSGSTKDLGERCSIAKSGHFTYTSEFHFDDVIDKQGRATVCVILLIPDAIRDQHWSCSLMFGAQIWKVNVHSIDSYCSLSIFKGANDKRLSQKLPTYFSETDSIDLPENTNSAGLRIVANRILFARFRRDPVWMRVEPPETSLWVSLYLTCGSGGGVFVSRRERRQELRGWRGGWSWSLTSLVSIWALLLNSAPHENVLVVNQAQHTICDEGCQA